MRITNLKAGRFSVPAFFLDIPLTGGRRVMTRFLMHCLLILASSLTPFAHAANFAGMSFCGGTVIPGDPTDLEHQVGEMSLQAAVDQPASITSCSKGYLLAKCGDHENANKIFDKCIAAGYAGAMIWKALETENGNGTAKDLKAAAELLKRAATSGDPAYEPIGKLHYATVLYHGRGVTQDKNEALKQFRAAAAQGSAEAAEFLRTGYHTGARDLEGMGAGVPTATALASMLTPEGIMQAIPTEQTNAITQTMDSKVVTRTTAIALKTINHEATAPAEIAPPAAVIDNGQTGLELKPVIPASPISEPLHQLWWLIALLFGAFLTGVLFPQGSSHVRIRHAKNFVATN